MKKKITIISCVLFLAAMMMFAQPAISGKWADTPSGLDEQILSAYVLAQEMIGEEGEEVRHVLLLILGYNFGNGDEPIVKLAGTPGDLIEWGDTSIIHGGEALWGIVVDCTVPILLPIPFPELTANLLLTVQTGPSVHQFDTFNIMLPDMLPDGPGPITSDFSLLFQ